MTSDRSRRYGPWAVVTGASSGIGEQIARRLAAEGFHLTLVARRADALSALAGTLAAEHGIRTRTLSIDLGEPDAAARLDEATADLDIGLLVSNAGWGAPGGFLHHDLDDERGYLQLNVGTPMELAHRFGHRFLRRDGGSRGGMIFTASTAGYAGVPNLANYAAGKAYVITLAEALNAELAPHGIDVMVLSPGPTRTGMVAIEGMDQTAVKGLVWMDAADVARAALDGLGRKQSVIPGVANRTMTGAMRRLMTRRGAGATFGRFLEKAIDEPIRASSPVPKRLPTAS